MKTQYKTAIFSSFMLVIAIAVAFFLTFFSENFIAKWFELMNAVLTGILTSALIILVTSLISYRITRQHNARSMGTKLLKLKNAFFYYVRYLKLFYSENKDYHLTRKSCDDLLIHVQALIEIVSDILSSEKLSPIGFKTIKRLKSFSSKLAHHEYAFFFAFSRFAEGLQSINRILGDLSYEKSDGEDKLREKLMKSIDATLETFSSENNLFRLTEQYLDDVKHVASVPNV